MKYFKSSLIVTLIGVLCGFALGYYYNGTISGGLNVAFIVMVLGAMEVSLSFDNAVVNATVLEDMSPIWRKRFITWGIMIAVFGMRLIFPILIVTISAKLGPIEAFKLAIFEPSNYEKILTNAEPFILAFGGIFLLQIGLKYFMDFEKDSHWFTFIEKPLTYLGKIPKVEVLLSLLVSGLMIFSVDLGIRVGISIACVSSLITYYIVELIGNFMESSEKTVEKAIKSGLVLFLYLELLDASFSFDGVIAAFALSNNIFIIMLGLGIGAMFVRSLTIMLVDKGTLTTYKYLEHGAFYAILCLSLIMLSKEFVKIPELISGFIGITFIGLSFLHSHFENKKVRHEYFENVKVK
jgi:uncharacterized protein